MTSLFLSSISKESFVDQRKIMESTLEKLDSIKNILEQRDELRRKLESSQSEFDALKREHEITSGDFEGKDSQTKIHFSYESTFNKLENLENDVKNLISDVPSPEIEGIMKEIRFLKEQLPKLTNLEIENRDLKLKLKNLHRNNKDDIPAETKQEKESMNYTERENNYSLQEFKIYKYRSQLLDEILRDRERLSEKLAGYSKIIEDYTYLQGSDRINDLEERLIIAQNEKISIEEELELAKCKLLYTELEMINQKAQEDNLNSKISCLEQEKECLSEEKDRLKQQNEYFQEAVKNLSNLQVENEEIKVQLRHYEALKEERNTFKAKYEGLIGLECEVDILRAQLQRARLIENERNLLKNQICRK